MSSSHLASHLSPRLNAAQPVPHHSYSSYPQSSSNYQPSGPPIVNNVVNIVNNSIVSPHSSNNPGQHPSSSNPLAHLQHAANNAYHSSMNSQQPSTNPMNMPGSGSLHPSSASQVPPGQLMHSNLPQPTAHHMQGSSEADQLNVSRQQMTTNSRLKSFIQNRQHNGITKPAVYSPAQSPIAYNSKWC